MIWGCRCNNGLRSTKSLPGGCRVLCMTTRVHLHPRGLACCSTSPTCLELFHYHATGGQTWLQKPCRHRWTLPHRVYVCRLSTTSFINSKYIPGNSHKFLLKVQGPLRLDYSHLMWLYLKDSRKIKSKAWKDCKMNTKTSRGRQCWQRWHTVTSGYVCILVSVWHFSLLFYSLSLRKFCDSCTYCDSYFSFLVNFSSLVRSGQVLSIFNSKAHLKQLQIKWKSLKSWINMRIDT